tara:strand:- start:670 stop:1101 length:432 start_codon:yes stop_codon:yes gene_type:complete
MSPEQLEVANAYIVYGDVGMVSHHLNIQPHLVSDIINKREVKTYIDTVYFDRGYRNRDKFAAILDEIIDSKIEEARESEFYSKKDLMEILSMVHKMKMDELKASRDDSKSAPSSQTNIQINSGFGEGNYGKLMETLLKSPKKE